MINIEEYYFADEEDAVEVDYESIMFIDFLKMARNSWLDGAPFDIDMRIISDSITSEPVKILQRKTVKVDDNDVYEIWAGVKVKSVDYLVPVRFYSNIMRYNELMFTWKSETPSQIIKVNELISAFEEEDEAKWDELLA